MYYNSVIIEAHKISESYILASIILCLEITCILYYKNATDIVLCKSLCKKTQNWKNNKISFYCFTLHIILCIYDTAYEIALCINMLQPDTEEAEILLKDYGSSVLLVHRKLGEQL